MDEFFKIYISDLNAGVQAELYDFLGDKFKIFDNKPIAIFSKPENSEIIDVIKLRNQNS